MIVSVVAMGSSITLCPSCTRLLLPIIKRHLFQVGPPIVGPLDILVVEGVVGVVGLGRPSKRYGEGTAWQSAFRVRFA